VPPALLEKPAIKEPAAGFEIVHPIDGAIMVYVPAGYFVMGMNADEADRHAKSLGYKDYHGIAAEEWFPRRMVFVDGYFVDKYEVTVEQWRRFEKGSGYVPKKEKADLSSANGSLDLYPAANILWGEAQRYANWAHKSLPTEAQWEKAARGTDGRLYPWGNEPLSDERGVFVKMNPNNLQDEITHYQRVGSKPAGASPYGCMDMAGNVYEWTSEWLEPYPNNPEVNEKGPWGHQFGVLRGGSFYHQRLAYACAKRFGLEPGETYYHMGFRSVWTPPVGYFESEAFTTDAGKVKARIDELAKLREKGVKVPPAGWS